MCKPHLPILVILMPMVISLTSCTVTQVPGQGWQVIVHESTSIPTPHSVPTEADSSLPAAGLSAEAAREIALRQFPTATVTLAERIEENGVEVWDVKLDNGMAVYIDSNTQEVLEIESWESERARQATPPVTSSTTITQPPALAAITDTEALDIASARFPGTTVVEIKSDSAYGVTVWDIELSNGVSVEINQANGDIVEISGAGQDWENPAYSQD